MPSPNEFTFLTDRVAALGRRICRKREVFLRLHGVANRIEENDEWEEREQRAGFESSLGASRPKDARARRRARVRLESSPRRDDKAMVISQAGGSTGPSKITGGGDDGKLNPAKSSVDRSTRDDRLRLPAIAIPRGQSRSSSLSEPSSTRCSHHSNGESRDKCKPVSHSYRNFTPRDSASKSADLPSVSPFSLSSVRPKKFGGYRPPTGVILKNLSSGSESESANETSRGLFSARKTDNTVMTLELSSPESTAVSTVNGPIKKMPIMSARNDITGSILPNLLPSSRSLDNDDLNHRIVQNISRSYIGQVNCDGTKACKELEKVNTLVKASFNERPNRDGFVAKTSSKLRQVEPEYEDTRYQKQDMSQDTLTFFKRSFMSELELVTSTYNEQVNHAKPTMKAYNEFKRVGSEFEDIQDEKEEVEDYRHIASKIHHDDKDQFEFNCTTDRSNIEANSLEKNGDILNVVEWNRSTSLYTKEAVDTPHFIGGIQNNVTEEALSSQTSEPYGSEDHSRSSCTAKIYSQKETLSSRRPQNVTPDKCDQEIMTKVPTLALNSQDISYSTSADSRECSATRPFDHHALIKALSDVSLKQEKQGEDVSRKREGFYRGKDTIDVSSRASDFPAKGETWRVPKFSISESPRKSLSRVPSRIPVRISNNKIVSPDNKLLECYKPENSNEIGNYAESKFTEQNGVPCDTSESIVHRINSPYSRICKRDSSQRSRNECIEVTIAEGVFAPDDEAEYEINDHAPGSLTSSNLRSPQSTPFGDYTYDTMQCLPENKFKRESCPPGFSHKTAYSSDRNYVKIDDDVRSRSDRSTSRKSGDTMDITSATESPGLSKYKKDESLRNLEENVTWRTEDECASINDEETLENVKDNDYVSRNKKLCLQANEHYKLATERMCDSLSFGAQHLQLDSLSEIRKGSRKRHVGDDLECNDDKLSLDQNLETTKIAQSENLMFQVCRAQELSNFAARISSSTLSLNCEPKRKKKKSQERFPFTISETSRALSTKQEDTSDYQSPNKNCVHTKMDQLQEKTVYQLKTHPSLTRLATSGMEDTVADILCCVAQEKKENVMSSKSKIKTFIRLFSSKLRKIPKQPNDDKTPESAKIIYENSACQADSKANSCSDDSSAEEAHKTRSNNHCIDHAARSKLTLVSSWEALKKTESLQMIAQEHPHRRYDCDDLWVQEIKDSSFDEKKDSAILQRKDEIDSLKESPTKDRYSIFLAKNLQSDKLSVSNRDNSPKEQHDVPISSHVVLSDEKSKWSIDQKISSNSEVEEIEEEDLTGCLCWRLCHIIAPSKYRSPIKEQVPASKMKKSDSLLQKRKK